MKIARYLHTAILVSDIAAAENFYGDILGLEKVDRSLKYPGVWYQIGEFQLHLIEDKRMKSELQNTTKWGRNPHVALGVDDLQAIQERIQINNLSLQMSASGRSAFFVQDPDGNVVEISQI